MYEFKSVTYMDLECTIINENDIDYINVSKWAHDHRTFREWYRQKSTKELINTFKRLLNMDKLMIRCADVPNQYRGYYVHIDLAIQVAQWMSAEFAFKVSRLVSSRIQDEMKCKYETLLGEKDDTITKMSKQINELLRKSDTLIEKSEITHAKLENTNAKLEQVQIVNVETIAKLTETNIKLDEAHGKLTETNTKLEKAHDKLENVHDKLDIVTDLIGDMCINTVPTEAWNKFGVHRIGVGIYKAVRCLRMDYANRIRKFDTNSSIFEIELPNGIEYFATFRSTYARNRNTRMNKVEISYNDIRLLDGVDEQDFCDCLNTHRVRIEKLIKEKIN